MKVDEPSFDSCADPGTVRCEECPFFVPLLEVTNTRRALDRLCQNWETNHKDICPTAETYAEACALAEAAEKEGSK